MRIIKSKENCINVNMHTFRPTPSLIACAILVMMRPAYAADIAESYFNPAFLSPDVASVADLSRFEKGNQLPGIYHVDIYVNDNYVGSRDIKFTESRGKDFNAGGEAGGLFPCVDYDLLSNLGVNTLAFPSHEKINIDKQCTDFIKEIPSSSVNYNFSSQKLNFSFPQAWIKNNAKGYIPSSEWDNGIPALLLNYNMSADNGTTGKSYFLSLGSGVNIGPWRLRNNSSWSYDDYSGYRNNRWSNLDTYLERSIETLKSELVIGESSTNNDVYDSIGFKGVRIYSDDAMYPDSQQGFAPTVRGIANSRSKVIIRQNGYIIYQTYVSPGPFVLDDLSPTSSSGDLTVTVQENNGNSHSFIVPYSTVPLLQREGRIKYDMVAGDFRSGNQQQSNPFFTQGTVIAGLNRGITVFGGTQLASNYRAFTAGLGKNMGRIGAISADLTQANSTLMDGSQHQGQSLRFLYAKSMNNLGTTFQLLGYRYSTRGFYTLDDTAYKNMEGYQYGLQDDVYGNQIYTATSYHNLNYTKKGRYQINVNQSLGGYGSMYGSFSEQSYWDTTQANKTYQFGYSNSWHSVNYNLSWSSTETVGLSDSDHVVALNVSVPMSVLLGSSYSRDSVAERMYLTSNATKNSNGNNTWQTGVSGTLLKDNSLSYNVMQGHSTVNDYSGNMGAQLQGRYGTLNTGYSYSKNNHDYNVQVAGGIIAHGNGITLSQPLGDTNILVKAPGAKDVSVENRTGVATDYRGYTVIPYADVYRLNRIALDTDSMNSKTDISDNVKNLVPTRGALVVAEFATRIGQRALITLLHDNKAIPFGASVLEKKTGSSGIIADNGQVYLSGLPQDGTLLVQWGDNASSKCVANYHITSSEMRSDISILSSKCE